MPPQFVLDIHAFDPDRILFTQEDIRDTNPQRGDMEMLNAISFVNSDQGEVAGFKDVRIDEFWVPGHIPGRPLFPGVLMIEAAAQLAAFYTKHYIGWKGFIGFGGVEETKFRAKSSRLAACICWASSNGIAMAASVAACRASSTDRWFLKPESSGHRCSPPGAGNPKSEYRNSKQARIAQTRNVFGAGPDLVLDLDIRICFGFRFSISDLVQFVPFRLKSAKRCRSPSSTSFTTSPLVFIDVETTGASTDFGDRVTEIGIVRIEQGQRVAEFQQLVDPQRRISAGVVALTGITQDMVTGQPLFADIRPHVIELMSGAVVLGHNVRFDLSFIEGECRRARSPMHDCLGSAHVMDTVRIARRRFGRGGNSLQRLAPRLGIAPDDGPPCVG